LNIISTSLSAEDAASNDARIAVIEAIWNASQIIPIENILLADFSVFADGVSVLAALETIFHVKQLRGRLEAASTTSILLTWEGTYSNQDVSFVNATESIIYLKQLFFAAMDDGSFVRVLESKFPSFAGASVHNASFEHTGVTVFPTAAPTSVPAAKKHGTAVGTLTGIVIGAMVGVCFLGGFIFYAVFGETKMWKGFSEIAKADDTEHEC
jgi:hypothetical protein